MRKDELKNFKEQKVQLLEELRSIGAQADSEADKRNTPGQWTQEEQEKFDKVEAEIRSVNERIERGAQLQHYADYDPERSASFSMEGQVPQTFNEWRMADVKARPWNLPEARAAFFHFMTTRGNEELTYEELRTLSKASGGAGAYLVPTDMYDQIIRAERLMGAIAQVATTITTSSGDTLNVPQNLTHGTASWVAENAGYVAADETFSQATLSAYKAGAKVIVSEELLTDSAFPLDSFIATEMGERIGFLEGTAFVAGDGSGKPTGIANAASGVTTVTAPTGSATSFKYSDLVAGIFSVPPQYRQGSVFVVSDGEAKNLYLMTDSQNRPLWNVNLAESGPDTFLGYPIYTDPNLPTPAASATTAIFGNIKRAYLIRRVDGFALQRQIELYSDNGQVGFRGYERVDGKVVLPDAIRLLQHSAT